MIKFDASYLVTAPTSYPVTVAEVKRHIRLDDSDGEPAPDAPTGALAGSGAGNLSDGDYRYKITFVTADGETEGGDASSVVTVSDNSSDGQVSLSAIAVGGSSVTSRKVYRTLVDGTAYFLLTTIADNTTTTYTDNTTDGSLGAGIPTTNTTVDPEINLLIDAATTYVENYLNRALITQTRAITLKFFSDYEISLPMPELQSITSIAYKDIDGDSQTLAASEYVVNTNSIPARIKPSENGSWPSTDTDSYDPITITYVCGYGDPADVPKPIKQAILIQIAHMYEYREREVMGRTVQQTNFTFKNLLQSYRVFNGAF